MIRLILFASSASAGFFIALVCAPPTEIAESLSQNTRVSTRPAYTDVSQESEVHAITISKDFEIVDKTVEAPLALTVVQYRLPNVHIEASEELLNAVLGSNTCTTGPFCEMIQGSQYRGMSTRNAQFSIRMEPADEAVALTLDWQATVNSNSHSVQQRTSVSSVSTTHIAASKRASYEDDGWHVDPSQATANSRSRITGVSTRRIIGRRVARRRAYEQRPSVDYSVARRAEHRTRSEFDNQASVMLASWESDLDRNIRQPLAERGQLPQLIAKRSTSDRIKLAFLQADAEEFGAFTDIPYQPSEQQSSDLALSLHQSAFNNFADGLLAGQRLREDELASQVEERLGWKLAGLEPVDSTKLWSVDFVEDKPLRVEFHDGLVIVTLEARGFTVGDQHIPGARLRTAFKLSIANGELTGTRQDRIAITPLAADKEDEKVGVRFQVFRSMLRRRFESIFPAEFTLIEFPTPTTWPSLATLHFSTATVQDEWLQLNGDLPSMNSPSRASLSTVFQQRFAYFSDFYESLIASAQH